MINPTIQRQIKNRGHMPDSVLTEFLAWAKAENDSVFAANSEPLDVFTYIKPVLGPWEDFLHRKAALLDEMTVHSGFESSWNWNEGVDVTNKTSMAHKTGQETGIFQVSFDSTWIANSAMKPFADANGIGDVDSFIVKMKEDHRLALRYYSRLVRINVQWAGPIKRHEIDPYLSRAAVAEWKKLLA